MQRLRAKRFCFFELGGLHILHHLVVTLGQLLLQYQQLNTRDDITAAHHCASLFDALEQVVRTAVCVLEAVGLLTW